MTVIDTEALLDLIEGDLELLEALVEQGILTKGAQNYSPDEVETVLVSRTLVRDLEINWAGVEVILRMRRHLLITRLRLAELSGESDS